MIDLEMIVALKRIKYGTSYPSDRVVLTKVIEELEKPVDDQRDEYEFEKYWRREMLQMAQDASESPYHTPDVLARAEEYLKFIQTGKAGK